MAGGSVECLNLDMQLWLPGISSAVCVRVILPAGYSEVLSAARTANFRDTGERGRRAGLGEVCSMYVCISVAVA